MKMIERNKTAETAALLIHPMLSSAEGIELCVTRFWGDSVHCFLPDLSSHGAAAGETYHSAWEEAKAIHDYLVEQNCTHLQLGFGASLGGVVLFELLKFEDLSFDHVFFEGVSFYERAPLLCFMLTRVFLSKHRTPHECRHTFETKLDSAGANRKCIDLLMGHVSKDTGNRVYNHKTLDELKATVELIP